MRLGKHAAMVGLATAMVWGCSNPPTEMQPTGTAGSNGTAGSSSGTAGSSSGTAGSSSGTAGSSSGTAGSSSGTAGSSSGTAGSGDTAGADGGAASSGAAGAGGSGTAGSGTAGAGGAAGGGTAGAGGAGGVIACPTGVQGQCNADTGAVDKYAGFTLLIAEEFDTPVNLDTDPIWTWSDGGPPEGQTRFNKSQISFSNGQMIITANGQTVPSSLSYAEPDQGKTTGMPGTRQVLSGEFRTKYNNYRYGRFEAKFAAPMENMGKSGDGNFLSTMFTFRTPKWNKWRELDNELEANIKGQVAYNLVNADGQDNYPGGDAGNLPPMGIASFNIQSMHTYMIEWLPTKVTWYVDGNVLRSNAAGDKIPTLSAKIMMNLWVFASAAAFGNPANNTYPFHSTYEYFRYYKWNMETTYPYADPKMLPADDVLSSQNNSDETTYP